jgi:hypothetical protein
VGLERGPLSLARITEELLEWKCSGSGSRELRLTAVEIRCADARGTFYTQKLTLTSPTCGGRSVSIVCLRTNPRSLCALKICHALINNPYLPMALQSFVGPWPPFSVSLSYTQSVGLLGRGFSPSQGRYLHTTCLQWDSNS